MIRFQKYHFRPFGPAICALYKNASFSNSSKTTYKFSLNVSKFVSPIRNTGCSHRTFRILISRWHNTHVTFLIHSYSVWLMFDDIIFNTLHPPPQQVHGEEHHSLAASWRNIYDKEQVFKILYKILWFRMLNFCEEKFVSTLTIVQQN